MKQNNIELALLDGEIVGYYPYSTVHVGGVLVTITGEEYKQLHSYMEKRMRKEFSNFHFMDNKIVVKIKIRGSEDSFIYVQFWDCKCTIAITVNPYSGYHSSYELIGWLKKKYIELIPVQRSTAEVERACGCIETITIDVNGDVGDQLADAQQEVCKDCDKQIEEQQEKALEKHMDEMEKEQDKQRDLEELTAERDRLLEETSELWCHGAENKEMMTKEEIDKSYAIYEESERKLKVVQDKLNKLEAEVKS